VEGSVEPTDDELAAAAEEAAGVGDTEPREDEGDRK
jgi:hypothetical protein